MELRLKRESAERRPSVVLFLTAAILTVFAVVSFADRTTSPSPGFLAAAGALTSTTLQTGQYWRLAAAGFLHASPVHLIGNLQMLLVCGPALERRLGSAAFALLYAAALIGGGLVSVLAHPAAFVGVGASGAIFGLLGALLALWIMGRAVVPIGFLLANLGLNAAITVLVPHVDWAAHLGGFVTGMVSMALLGLWARIAGAVLRCVFPEFVTINALLLLVAAGGVWMFPARVFGFDPAIAGIATWAAGAWAFMKLLDIMLASRHGLAGVVGLFAACNGLAAYAGLALLRPVPAWAPGVAVAVCALTLLLYLRPLRRGLADVGFVGAALAGERRRRCGP